MGRKPKILLLIAAFILVMVAIPVTAKIEHQTTEIKTAAVTVQDLRTSLAQREADLKAHQERTESDLKRLDGDLANARQQVDQLKKEVDAARAPRPAVRLAEPSVNTSTAKVEIKAQVTVGKSGNCESYRSLVAAYFPASQVNNALLAMRKESGCSSSAISPAGDYGLMQVHCSAHRNKVSSCQALLNPQTNIRVAAQIYRESGGWGPWTTMR